MRAKIRTHQKIAYNKIKTECKTRKRKGFIIFYDSNEKWEQNVSDIKTTIA